MCVCVCLRPFGCAFEHVRVGAYFRFCVCASNKNKSGFPNSHIPDVGQLL